MPQDVKLNATAIIVAIIIVIDKNFFIITFLIVNKKSVSYYILKFCEDGCKGIYNCPYNKK